MFISSKPIDSVVHLSDDKKLLFIHAYKNCIFIYIEEKNGLREITYYLKNKD